jgi:hypothetical protein
MNPIELMDVDTYRTRDLPPWSIAYYTGAVTGGAGHLTDAESNGY